YAQGLEGGAGRASGAASGLGDAASAGARGGAPGARGGRSGGGNVINLVFPLPSGASGGGAQEAAEVLSQPSFIALLTKAIEDACTSVGAPMQEAPAS